MIAATLLTLVGSLAGSPNVAKATITVQVDRPGIRLSRDLYGIFFEEINCGGDGGLYAELVRNRSFEDAEQPAHWSFVERGNAKGSMGLDKSQPQSKENPTSLKLTLDQGAGSVGASNHGYWGIPVKKGETYAFSCLARSDGSAHELTVTLESVAGQVYAKSSYQLAGPYWATFSRQLTSTTTDPDARVVLSIDKPGTVWLDLVSLFPKTYKNRDNGLRIDLAQKLADIHPSFMRFPGGCWVEGETMATSSNWKRTIGELGDRWTQPDLWQYTSTNGLGFHEYLQLCEDIGAAPLFVINVGMSHREVVPMDRMESYVQDALDAIEYANGPVSSKWGSLRARKGHPESFHLKYMEIGNENGGAAYRQRFYMIAKAVHDRYPDVRIVEDVWGGYPRTEFTDLIDEHYYNSPQFFFENADRYDRYDRRGPKVYVGEYAVTQGCGNGNLIAAIGEAAFMTGMERNSDVVQMCSYAPLFANVNHKTWNPDLINFDNHRSLGTPSFYVQKMFSSNRGDRLLPTTIVAVEGEKATYPPGGIGVGTWGTQAEFKDIKVVATNPEAGLSASRGAIFESTDGAVLTRSRGSWSIVNGTLNQAASDEPSLAYGGSPTWTNYTLTLKARKTGGREGFLINFGFKDPKNWIWWNIGGWGNTQHQLERSIDGGKASLGRPVSGRVETGRWYEVKVEFSPERIKCFLDGKLIHDVPCPSPKPLYVVSSQVEKTGEIIMKIVNAGAKPLLTTFDLRASSPKAPTPRGSNAAISGSVTTLTSASPLDENSLDQPAKVSPVTSGFTSPSPSFIRILPAYSVTILRAKPN